MRISNLVTICLMLALCACSAEKDFTVVQDQAQIQQLMKDLEQVSFDLSKVLVARLSMGGQEMDATSLTPVSMGGKAKTDSRTILKVDNKSQTLMLFTYDAAGTKAYQAAIDLKSVDAGSKLKNEVVFPVADATGVIQEKIIRLDKVLSK